MNYFFIMTALWCFTSNAYTVTILTKPLGASRCQAHQAALRSILEGLRRCNVAYNLNPATIGEIGDVVHLMAGDINSLDQLRQLKEDGHIKKIVVGPNVAEFCRVGNPYVYAPYIDAILSLGDWVIEGFIQAYPTLDRTKVKQWFHGVDIDYWKPLDAQEGRYVLVYNKHQSELTHTVDTMLRTYNWIPIHITYGAYSPAQFKDALQKSRFAVFLSHTESQGIALAEAWAMDVPTFVWNSKTPHTYLGITYAYSSACPFLTPATGYDWQTIDDFTYCVQHAEELVSSCSPRDWVIHNMSDEVSARALLAIINAL